MSTTLFTFINSFEITNIIAQYCETLDEASEFARVCILERPDNHLYWNIYPKPSKPSRFDRMMGLHFAETRTKIVKKFKKAILKSRMDPNIPKWFIVVLMRGIEKKDKKYLFIDGNTYDMELSSDKHNILVKINDDYYSFVTGFLKLDAYTSYIERGLKLYHQYTNIDVSNRIGL